MPRMTKAEKAEQQARIHEAKAIVAKGICPQCGSKIRRNSSMTGWYQCEQLGAIGFRADAAKPPCSWQTFTN